MFFVFIFWVEGFASYWYAFSFWVFAVGDYGGFHADQGEIFVNLCSGFDFVWLFMFLSFWLPRKACKLGRKKIVKSFTFILSVLWVSKLRLFRFWVFIDKIRNHVFC